MALHHTHHHRGTLLPPLQRRRRERLAGGVFQAITRIAGIRPEMIPEYLRRQLRIIGATDEQLARVLPRLRSLGAWPYAWEAEGDARYAAGDMQGAFTAYYIAQRILLGPSVLKHRLYALAVAAYQRIEQPQLERFVLANERGQQIAGYLQLPAQPRAAGRQPCVLMVPGITGTKEELHAYAIPLLRRGLAIARIDNPVYGETEGLLDDVTVTNARVVLEHLAKDPRLDPDALHLHGMSMGANFAVQAAFQSCAASLTLICPPYDPGRYTRELPTMNLTALQHMTHCRTVDELVAFIDRHSLAQIVPHLRVPIRIFHGGRDRTIPVIDSHALAAAHGGPVALTVYERDHHNCLEHVDEITALTLEFVADPVGTCQRHADVQRIDAAATIHVTDEDALLAGMGLDPHRRAARLPFHLRSLTTPRKRAAN